MSALTTCLGIHFSVTAWISGERTESIVIDETAGSFTKGAVKMKGGKLVHEFEKIQSDGKSAAFIARVTPQDATGEVRFEIAH